MKRVGLFLGASGAGSGTFQYSQTVLEAMASRAGSEYTLVARYVDPAWGAIADSYGVQARQIERGSVRRTRDRILLKTPLPVSLWRRTLARFHSVPAALLAARCDLWVFPAQDSWTYLAPVAALGTVHDLMHRYEPGFPEVSDGATYAKREQHYGAMCRWARAILVDSRVGRQHVLESYSPVRAELLVLPYVPPRHVRTGVADAGLREDPRLPPKFFFYPASFWTHKNHSRLLAALARVRQRHPDVALVFAGGKENAYAAVRAQVDDAELGSNVVFLDYLPDNAIAYVYSRARALVMPTFFGPTNIPPLEAFALGCPVATSRIYGVPEQLGDAALLFDPRSVDEIEAALEQLWTDDVLCAALAQRGRQKAEAWGLAQFAATLDGYVRELLSMQQRDR